MHFVSEDIENYCIQHSRIPSSQCKTIEDYTRANVPHSVMLIGELEGSFLSFLVRLTGAKRALELGTFTGYSALVMAESLPADGEVVTLDINPETNAIAQRFWAQSPHGKKIRPLLGPGLETLATLQGPFDLVFIDADKPNYIAYLDSTLPLLSPRGLIVADNTLFGGEVLEPDTKDSNARAIRAFNDYVKNQPELEVTQLPVRDGMTLIRRR